MILWKDPKCLILTLITLIHVVKYSKRIMQAHFKVVEEENKVKIMLGKDRAGKRIVQQSLAKLRTNTGSFWG
jgi:hypothetical protein